jgi:hypothetical protein
MQPGRVRRRISGLRHYNSELPQAAASELFLHFSAFHDGHTAHLHGAPDHPSRITPVIRTPVDLPRFRFRDYAGHFSIGISLLQYAQNRCERKKTAPVMMFPSLVKSAANGLRLEKHVILRIFRARSLHESNVRRSVESRS